MRQQLKKDLIEQFFKLPTYGDLEKLLDHRKKLVEYNAINNDTEINDVIVLLDVIHNVAIHQDIKKASALGDKLLRRLLFKEDKFSYLEIRSLNVLLFLLRDNLDELVDATEKCLDNLDYYEYIDNYNFLRGSIAFNAANNMMYNFYFNKLYNPLYNEYLENYFSIGLKYLSYNNDLYLSTILLILKAVFNKDTENIIYGYSILKSLNLKSNNIIIDSFVAHYNLDKYITVKTNLHLD